MTNIIRKHANKNYESEIIPLFSGKILIIFSASNLVTFILIDCVRGQRHIL